LEKEYETKTNQNKNYLSIADISDGLDKSPIHEQEESIFTVKATSRNLILLSKFLAELRTQYSPLNFSRIFVNPATKEYFAYVNFAEAKITERLQDVSAFPVVTQ
jgi:hypothetical protein